MIEFLSGGMGGRIGRILWLNGSDCHPDPATNAVMTGYERFGHTTFMTKGLVWRLLRPRSPFYFD